MAADTCSGVPKLTLFVRFHGTHGKLTLGLAPDSAADSTE